MMRCSVCESDDGRPVFRASPKGETAVWVCDECRPTSGPVKDLVDAIAAPAAPGPSGRES